MENTFRGPLAPGYSDIINLTVNKRLARHQFSDTQSLPIHFRENLRKWTEQLMHGS